MTAEDFVRAIRLTIEDLKAQGPNVIETMALTGKSLVQDRIQREGFGATYSDKYVPAFFLYGKAINAGGRAYLADNNLRDDLTNWKELRKAEGLQTAFVDLTHTGRMWNSLTVIRNEQAEAQFRAYIGSTDSEGEKKLLYSANRYGDFLALNPSERIEVEEVARDLLETIIKKRLT
jgi:hypothetical protein